MTIPVIIMHIGNQEYLNICIKNNEYFNNNVYLIGDENNKKFCKNHINYKNIKSELLEKFDKLYKHISPNNIPFEKICIQRWFYIAEFMKKQQINKAFVCDSDVLLYCNINEVVNKYYKDDFYFVTMNDKIPVNACQSIWTLKKINEFINFIINFYENSDWTYVINYWNNYNNKLSGGISDMYLLYCYITKTTFKQNNFKLDTKLIPSKNDLTNTINNSFFDNSINKNMNCFNNNKWDMKEYNYNIANMENIIKNIEWINRLPYCYNYANKKKIKCNSIHFHGCKNLILNNSILINKKNKISAIFFSLNDNYTKDNKERLIIALNYMLDCVDEVVYVDWGSPNNVSLLELPYIINNIPKTNKLVHVKISRKEINNIVPKGNHFIQQSIIRNIAIRKSTGDYIISTNVDIIFPNKQELYDVINNDDKQTFYSISRKDVPMNSVINLYNEDKTKLRKHLSSYIKVRGIDNNPEYKFKIEAKTQISENSELYKQYIKYARIWNCGDFQMAHRSIWFNVKGFEEKMLKTSFCSDTNLQKKICNYGYKLKILNKPDVFHMSHPARSSHNNKKFNDLNRFLINFNKSENDDKWGILISF